MKKIPLLVLAMALASVAIADSYGVASLSLEPDPYNGTDSTITYQTSMWVVGTTLAVLLGALIIDFSHVDDRSAGPVIAPTPSPAAVPELSSMAGLGTPLLLTAGGALLRRRFRNQ